MGSEGLSRRGLMAWIFLTALSHSFWPGAAEVQTSTKKLTLSVTALKNNYNKLIEKAHHVTLPLLVSLLRQETWTELVVMFCRKLVHQKVCPYYSKTVPDCWFISTSYTWKVFISCKLKTCANKICKLWMLLLCRTLIRILTRTFNKSLSNYLTHCKNKTYHHQSITIWAANPLIVFFYFFPNNTIWINLAKSIWNLSCPRGLKIDCYHYSYWISWSPINELIIWALSKW